MKQALFQRHRTLVLIGLVTIWAAGLSGCNQPQQPTANQRIVVASPRYVLTGLLFLAIDQGFFSQQGLDVVIDFKPSGKQSVEALFEQKAQIALTAETAIVKTIMTGKRLAILGSLGDSFGDFLIVGRRNKGIYKPEDLRGKSIAVEIGTAPDYFLDAVLANHGIRRDEIRIMPTSTDKIGEALVAGEVDAGSGPQPYATDWVKQLGPNAYSYSNPRYYTLTWYITSTMDYVGGHDATLKKFFLALREAERQYQAKPENMRRVLAEQAKISEELYDNDVYRFALRADQAMLVILESLSQWALKRGIVPEQPVPNYLDYFETGPIKAAKPDVVTIVH